MFGVCFWTNQAQIGQNTKEGRVAGAIRYLVNARDLQIECARVLHETLLRMEEKSRLRAVQMDNLRELLGIRLY